MRSPAPYDRFVGTRSYSVYDRPFTWSLITFCIALVVAPTLPHIDIQGVAYYVSLILAIFGATERRWVRRTAIAYAIGGTAAHLGNFAAGAALPAIVLHLVDLAFAAVTPVLVIRRVLTQTEIDSEEMAGALMSYALIGVLFGMIHGAVSVFIPGAYANANYVDDPNGFTYFSFVTLTTLGYGHIIPMHPVARGLSILEAFIGQGYLAILVARLVGLHTSMQRQKAGS